jgi:hypothetical protein
MLKSFINTSAIILAFVLLVDFLFFCAWVASNQKPVDDFYFGTITAHVVKLLI